mmetsp:Transcript_30128/g.66322  ORF Transcript_30128/g.66322 Transcript_30128/m.66322 type:complete len:204 (+) Transcript_30128:554-1165(+)
MPAEISLNNPVAASTGNSTTTVRKLKQSCTVAPAKARRYSSLLPIWNMETIVFVTDVPIFAPIIMGMAFFTSMRLLAVMLMMIDVLVDDDWTNTVARIPNTRPAIGLSKISLLRNTCPAVGPAMTLKASPMIPSEMMKEYRNQHTKQIFITCTNTVVAFSTPVFSPHALSSDSSTSTSHTSFFLAALTPGASFASTAAIRAWV